VKKLDYENKQNHNILTAKQNSYDEKVKDLTGSGQVSRVKEAITKLKAIIKDMSLNEGVMESALFGC